MRKLFNSKQKQEEAYDKGWAEGFEIGRSKAVTEFRKVMIARIQKDIKNNSEHNKNIIAGMEKAIELIRKIR
jgi:flagellar biosynthesis/type III secretory pathway protein FliH